MVAWRSKSFDITIPYQNMKTRYKHTTVQQPSYLYNAITFIRKYIFYIATGTKLSTYIAIFDLLPAFRITWNGQTQ